MLSVWDCVGESGRVKFRLGSGWSTDCSSWAGEDRSIIIDKDRVGGDDNSNNAAPDRIGQMSYHRTTNAPPSAAARNAPPKLVSRTSFHFTFLSGHFWGSC